MNVGVIEMWSFLLVFARVSALFATAPVLGTRTIPARVKAGLAALVSLAIRPLVERVVSAPPDNLVAFAGQIGAEVFVGLCLGFIASLVIMSIQIAGAFLDTQMGFGMMQVLNPMTGQTTGDIGNFLNQLALSLFIIGGGPLELIRAVVAGYATVPPGAVHLAGDPVTVLIAVVTGMFELAFKIALPAAAVLLAVDVAFAIISRSMPQMNIFMVGVPAKVVIGLSTLAMLLPPLATKMHDMMGIIMDGYTRFLPVAR